MFTNLREFLAHWHENTNYFEMLKLMASLSKLFSESTIPYLDYRLTENLFCKYYNALNDARLCTAYDARISNVGIGIKTFGINKGISTEKIAEFNKLKPILNSLNGIELAKKIAQFRNDRMDFSNNTYGIDETQYHIIGRQEGCLRIFNTPYEKININSICDVKDKENSISFNDGINEYSFNKSKSVLQKRFEMAKNCVEIPIDILEDPLELLASSLRKRVSKEDIYTHIQAPQYINRKGIDYVVLPLYSNRGGMPNIPPRSGLNQWNANGRPRNFDEIYIPIPKLVHNLYPQFFPNRDQIFSLLLPSGAHISAKICQDGGKALMSNPNSALGEWLLRKVLRKPYGEIVTIDDLYTYGIDSVKIISTHKFNDTGEAIYKIEFTDSSYENYQSFISTSLQK